ncbi:MAG: NADH-quinone oxidoreductase subunit M [Roseibacillus sp.]|nr:NADH-quinone oxidoreductase subunit M [Roseibacillus sp.]
MTACLVLTPLIGVIAILMGRDPKATARLTTTVMLITGILLAGLWAMGIREGLSMDPIVLNKPEIRLGLGLYDGMSVIMMLLSVTVAFAAARTGSCEKRHEALWNISLLLIAAGAIGAFISTDLFFFYAFHELALIPTFLMIGILGRGERKIIAWKATIYLAFGSIVLLAGLLWLVSSSGTSSLAFEDLLKTSIPSEDQQGIALFLIIGFGTLVSLFPFHSWAAPTYASAPAPISMLHAGVLKKFGLYGLLRLHPLVPEGMSHWLNLVIVLLIGNILWVGLVTINQKRLDLMLGNSSVMHMGYIFLAFAALIEAGSEAENPVAMPAAILLMFAHGVTIAMLLGLTDRIEKKTGTLDLRNLGGLASLTPRLAFLFGLAAMASIGLPGLANFAGEVMVFIAGFKGWQARSGMGSVQIATIIALWGLVISAVYMLRAYRKTFQGPKGSHTTKAEDLSPSERKPAIFLAFVLVIVGIFPNLLLGLLGDSGSESSESRELQPPSKQVLLPDPEPKSQQAILAN